MAADLVPNGNKYDWGPSHSLDESEVTNQDVALAGHTTPGSFRRWTFFDYGGCYFPYCDPTNVCGDEQKYDDSDIEVPDFTPPRTKYDNNSKSTKTISTSQRSGSKESKTTSSGEWNDSFKRETTAHSNWTYDTTVDGSTYYYDTPPRVKISNDIMREPSFLKETKAKDSEQGHFSGLFDQICSPVLDAAKQNERLLYDELGAREIYTVKRPHGHTSPLRSSLSTPDVKKYMTKKEIAVDAIINAQEKKDAESKARKKAEALSMADQEDYVRRNGKEMDTHQSALSSASVQSFSPAKARKKAEALSIADQEDYVQRNGKETDTHQSALSSASVQSFSPESSWDFQPDFVSEFPVFHDNPRDPETEEIQEPSETNGKNRLLRPFRHMTKKANPLHRNVKNLKKPKFAWPSVGRAVSTDPPQDQEKETISNASPSPIQVNPDSTNTMDSSPSGEKTSIVTQRQGNRRFQRPSHHFKNALPIIEEIEVLRKRKEPVYSSYMRTPSNVLEGVEILRKESLAHETSDIHKLVPSFDELALQPAPTDEVTVESAASDSEQLKEVERKEEMPKSMYFVELDKENDQYVVAASKEDSNFESITARLAREAAEPGKMQKQLNEEDQDLGELQKLLGRYENETILEDGRPKSTSQKQPDNEMVTQPQLQNEDKHSVESMCSRGRYEYETVLEDVPCDI